MKTAPARRSRSHGKSYDKTEAGENAVFPLPRFLGVAGQSPRLALQAKIFPARFFT